MNQTVIVNKIVPTYELWEFVVHLGNDFLVALKMFEGFKQEIIDICNMPVETEPNGRRHSVHNMTKELRVLVMQLEQGKRSGGYHVQGYFRLNYCAYYSSLKMIFTMFPLKNSIFFGKPLGDINHCEEYSMKGKTRVPDTEPWKIIVQNN